MSSTMTIDDQTFEQEVLKTSQLVLVDFWAPWCGPCRMLGPLVDELALSMADSLKVVKIDIDKNSTVATQYGIRTIPTMMLFKEGKAVATQIGLLTKQKLEEWVKSHH